MTIHAVLKAEDFEYNSLLLHPREPLLFAGTDHGLVEVWDLKKQKIKAKLRYLKLDEFGETYPVEDPVVTLAAPLDFSLVYAFMGNAAYCIDVELLTIVQKVPISENVVGGNIGPQSGNIGVITEPGYLSRWSPKFVERVASMDLPYSVENCYLLHDFDESRVILTFPNDRVLLTRLDAEPYIVDLQIPDSGQLTDGIWYDRNQNYQVVITEEGNIDVHDGSSQVPEMDNGHLLAQGRSQAEMMIREFVMENDTGEDKREYITDFRLLRQSRDRYVAEVEKLRDESKHESSVANDSKTLHFALQEADSTDIDKKTTAYSVIEKISDRHDIDPRYVFYAKKLQTNPTGLIEDARYLEFEAHRRNSTIKKYLTINLVLVLLAILLAEIVTFTPTTLPIFGVLVAIIALISFYLSNINQNPRIPGVNTYLAFQRLILISLIVALGLMFYNSFLDILPLPI